MLQRDGLLAKLVKTQFDCAMITWYFAHPLFNINEIWYVFFSAEERGGGENSHYQYLTTDEIHNDDSIPIMDPTLDGHRGTDTLKVNMKIQFIKKNMKCEILSIKTRL